MSAREVRLRAAEEALREVLAGYVTLRASVNARMIARRASPRVKPQGALRALVRAAERGVVVDALGRVWCVVEVRGGRHVRVTFVRASGRELAVVGGSVLERTLLSPG